MSEFKIKVSVQLDDNELNDKLGELEKNHEIPVSLDMKKIDSQLKGLKKSFQDAFKIDSKTLSDLNKLTNAQEKLTKQQNKQSLASQKGEMKNLVNEYKDFANAYAKLQKQMNSGTLGEGSIKRTAMQMSELKTNMSQLYNEMDSNAKKQIDLFNTKQMNKGIVDMNSAMNKIESQATSLLTRLNNIKLDNLGEIDLSKLNKAKSQLEEFIALCKQDIDINLDVGSILSDLSKLTNETKNFEKIQDVFDKVEKASKQIDLGNFTNEVKDLVNYVDKMDGSFERVLKGANNNLKDVQSTIKKISSDTRGKGIFGSILGTRQDFLGNFSQFTLAEIAGDFIADGIRTMARGIKDTIVETDKAIVDLNKVYDNNLTGDNLKGYLNSVTEVAKGTGKSSVDVIQGTAKAVQSGIKDIDDALVFARQSAMFSNVGDVSQEQADTMLASIMSAYGGVENSLKPVREQVSGMGKDYNTLTKFMDLANHAGNKYAVTTSDIGTALQASSAALKTNGVTMEESVAMAAAMNEVLQDSSKTGNALKSISANMAGVTVSAKDGTIQMNKSAKALKEIAGIEVWNKQTGQVKDMYEVMDELSGKWDSLSEVQQNALGITIAGKIFTF